MKGLRPSPLYGVISITDPGRIANLSEGWGSILRLQFDDVEEPDPYKPYGDPYARSSDLFTAQDANKIIQWLDANKRKLAGIYVHCWGGVSRSAAVAKFIAEKYGIPFDHSYDKYNRLVYNILKQVAGEAAPPRTAGALGLQVHVLPDDFETDPRDLKRCSKVLTYPTSNKPSSSGEMCLLWTSTLTSKTSGWLEWCAYEYPVMMGERAAIYSVKPGAKVYDINSAEAYDELYARYPFPYEKAKGARHYRLLDWGKVAEEYDAVRVSEAGLAVPELDGWSSESTVWFDATKLSFDRVVDVEGKCSLKIAKLIYKGATYRRAYADDYFYHITYVGSLPAIAARGLCSGTGTTFSKGYQSYSTGKIFLSEWDGVGFWVDRLGQMAENRSDNPVQDGLIPIVIRIPESVVPDVEEDVPGTHDANAGAWTTIQPISSSVLQVYDGASWTPVSSIDHQELINEAYEAAEKEFEDDELLVYLNASQFEPIFS